ncbi:MAG: PKD domain-containing protein, partial [Myxococcales bacterium]|nr:PKD domain-containing protein [Myxococcales bacterium]
MRWLPAVLLSALLGCDDGATPSSGGMPDAAVDQAAVDAARDMAPEVAVDGAAAVAVVAAAGPDQAVDVGAQVLLDGSASQGAHSFQWDFGDGRRQEAPGAEPAVTVRYVAPGRYRAVLTVYSADGRRRTDGALITVTHPPRHTPQHSATLAAVDAHRVVALSTDGATLTVVDTETLTATRRATGPQPRRLAVRDGRWVGVTRPDDDLVEIHDLDGGAVEERPMGPGAAPFGIVALGDDFAVTLQGPGVVAVGQHRWPVGPDLRGIAALPDGRLAVTRWRSTPAQGELWALDPASGATTPWALAFDPQLASDTEIGGVPTWLDQVVVSPAGTEAAVPALQANVGQGLFLNGERLDFDLALRAVVAFIDPVTGAERFEQRKQFDGRGFASAAAYSPRGDYLYVATRGSRTVERLDRLTGTASGTLLDVGFAPEGLLVHGGRLWVEASLSRALVVYDLDAFDTGADPVARVPLVDAEPLEPALRRGKVLFNDSADPRLSRDGYIACAHCHLDGDGDNLVWDFTDRGEGLRNTLSLLGRAGTGHGPLHWSANFDEVQDF